MRKIIASTFVTLDGVFEAPGPGDTTLLHKKGWTMPYSSPDLGQHMGEAMGAADAMLLGRVTYEGFAEYWSKVPEDDPFGNLMNNRKKYVLSTTLDKADWKNSTLIKDNVVEELNRIKQEPGQNIAIVGSGTLINRLMADNLIDEFQLLVYPVVLGEGKRLFQNGTEGKLKLVSAKTFESGVVLMTYQPA